jgi:hypothetical protein
MDRMHEAFGTFMVDTFRHILIIRLTYAIAVALAPEKV